MSSGKSTKRALICSVLAVLMCAAMLIGTTFAWFTDTASTGVNKIVAGNLKVGFQYWNGEKYVDAKDQSLFSEETLWEPGHAEVVYLKVVNQGSLALKYKLNTINTWEWKNAKNSDGETILLSKYLQIGIAEGKNAAEGVYANRDEAVAAAADNLVSYDSYTKYSTLLPAANGDESADYFAFVVYMPTTVGNEANSVNGNNPAIRFNLALNATQASYEEDSFDNTYDESVPYPVAGVDENGTGDALYDELERYNPSILLGADAARSYGWFVRYATTIDLNGNAMTTSGYQSAINVTANGDLTITGNGTVDASGGTDNVTAVSVNNGGKLTIENGTFIGKSGNSCIYNAGGTVEIKGGKFMIADDPQWTLNCLDNSGATIVVTGGTFYKFDPSNANTGAGEIVVPTGYKVVNDGDWYTVVSEPVTNADELAAALKNNEFVVLSNDITITGGVEAAENMKQTLDFNGHKIILGGEDQWSYGYLEVFGELTFTDSVGNGGISGEFYHSPTKVPTAVFINDGAVVNLESGTIENVYRGVANYYTGGTFNMTGGKIAVKRASEIESAGVLFRRGGTVNLTGGEISGAVYFEQTATTRPAYTVGAGFTNSNNSVFNTSGITATQNADGIWTSTIQ